MAGLASSCKYHRKYKQCSCFVSLCSSLVSECIQTSSRRFCGPCKGKWQPAMGVKRLQKLTPTLSLRASAIWHHGPVERRGASEWHICKRKGTCFWKVGVSNSEEVTRFKCNNTDFLFIHMCLSRRKGLWWGSACSPLCLPVNRTSFICYSVFN